MRFDRDIDEEVEMRGILLVLAVGLAVSGCAANDGFCGDGYCGGGEACTNCSMDCGSCSATCGNGVCDLSETCASCPSECGSCAATACAETCLGCCDGESCLGGNSSAACGVGGLECVDCGPDGICVDGGCALDPASRWNVVLDDLSVAATRYDGAPWDTIGGNPDPYVTVRVGSTSATPVASGVANNAYNVTYDGGATVQGARADALLAYLRFDVFDDDSPASAELIGACFVNLGGGEFSGGLQTADCPVDASSGNSGYLLHWHLERY